MPPFLHIFFAQGPQVRRRVFFDEEEMGHLLFPGSFLRLLLSFTVEALDTQAHQMRAYNTQDNQGLDAVDRILPEVDHISHNSAQKKKTYAQKLNCEYYVPGNALFLEDRRPHCLYTGKFIRLSILKHNRKRR